MKRHVLPLLLAALVAVSVNTQVSAGGTPVVNGAADGAVRDAFSGVLPVTDGAMKMSLNGVWSLKVVKGSVSEGAVPETDGTWGTIPVPGCWEAHGFCKPRYDSPEALTGYYRTSFTIPEAWRGMRIVLRFDGVLYGYDLWVNGKAAGSWRSGYNTALFDITPYVSKGGASQELAMRVFSQFRGSDFDYNDDWAPCGINRDVTLMAVPETHVSDLTIRTKNSGEVAVDVAVAGSVRGVAVSHEVVDARGHVVGRGGSGVPARAAGRRGEAGGVSSASALLKVDSPRLWTAETPSLYTLRTTLTKGGRTLQTFEHRFGFRELTVEGNVLKLNGRPVKLRGVTTHATDPRTVKVIGDTLTLKDMRLMKEASVNYIRTSHYPREPRFYELADSLGFYVIDEVPFGYGDRNLQDSTFYPVLQQRAQATIRRDKNHPSVLIWSLGNENPLTDICIRLASYVKESLDASRPVCYPQIGSYFLSFNYDFPSVADIYAPHYPTTSQIAGVYQRADRPVIFTEYLHTLGISFEDHDRQWELIERTPGIAGGSVWEWVDQGMPFSEARRGVPGGPQDHTPSYGYTEKVYTHPSGGFEMNGNKGTDGVLYADRTPLPNYWELQRNYAQAFVADSVLRARGATLPLTVVNRFDFLDLKDNVTFRWAYSEDRDTLARGAFSPPCAPRSRTAYELTLPSEPDARRVCLLHVEVSDGQGRVTLRQSIPVGDPALTSRLLAGLTEPCADPMALVQDGLLVRVGRKATLAETMTVGRRRLERYLRRLRPEAATAGPVAAVVSQEPAAGAVHVTFTLTPDSSVTFLSELGLALLLDDKIDRVQWVGQGPMATYPGRFRAGRYGFWQLRAGDLLFEGNRRGVDAALFTDARGEGLLLFCTNGNVSFEQTDRGIVVTCNAAVAGEGPKFSRTAFPLVAREVGAVTADFYLYRVGGAALPAVLRELFADPAAVAAPFRPYVTQYDTYLMRYADIVE